MWVVVLVALVSLTAGPRPAQAALTEALLERCACPCCESPCEDEVRRASCCEREPASEPGPAGIPASAPSLAVAVAPSTLVCSPVPLWVRSCEPPASPRVSTGPPLWLRQRALLL